MERFRKVLRGLLCAVLLAAGAGACLWLVETAPAPDKGEVRRAVPVVQVEEVRPREFASPILGHGTLRPEKQVRVVPNVNGRLIYAHEDLAEGKFIEKGELLFEIDATVYQAQVDTAEANVRRLNASIARQKEELIATQERLAVAQDMLEIAERERDASESLEDGTLSGVRVNADRQSYLRLKGEVVELGSKERMIPLTLDELEAQLDAACAALRQATFDLENTKIVCPFDARVESATAFASQYVTAFVAIATLTDVSSFEISAVVDPRELRWVHDGVASAVRGDSAGAEAPEVVVRWSLYGRQFSCRGRVTRFERLDEATRTARIVVQIRNVVLGLDSDGADETPPISIGTFCQTEIPARAVPGALTVPRHAVYEDAWVYVYEDDPASSAAGEGLLGRRRVTLLRTAGDDVLVGYEGIEVDGAVETELAAGDRIITSPLPRPVPGMPIRLAAESPAALEADGGALEGGVRVALGMR